MWEFRTISTNPRAFWILHTEIPSCRKEINLGERITIEPQSLAKWRHALREELDPNGQLIVDLVPELKLIIGEQPPVPEVQQRTDNAASNSCSDRFIGIFARPEHPLALFLDDLQWLDAATLDLLEDLLTRPDIKHLMLIGAYRDNEVNSAHPLIRKLETIHQTGAKSTGDRTFAPRLTKISDC